MAIAQDRAEEKAHFAGCGVPVAPYALIETPAQLDAVGADLLPGILKTTRMGYDGKGQVRVADRAALKEVLGAMSAVPKATFDGWSKPQQMAFLINAYNAFTVELILSKYPDLKSIKDLGSFVQ